MSLELLCSWIKDCGCCSLEILLGRGCPACHVQAPATSVYRAPVAPRYTHSVLMMNRRIISAGLQPPPLHATSTHWLAFLHKAKKCAKSMCKSLSATIGCCVCVCFCRGQIAHSAHTCLNFSRRTKWHVDVMSKSVILFLSLRDFFYPHKHGGIE